MIGVSSVGLILSIFTGGNNLGNMSAGREEYQQALRNRKLTLIQEQNRIANEQTAQERLKNCIPYVSGDYKTGFKFPTLHQSLIIRDRETNLPLPDGYLVCDAHGGTAVIREGKPTSIKYTGNRKALRERISRYRGGIYQQPFINNYSQPHTKK